MNRTERPVEVPDLPLVAANPLPPRMTDALHDASRRVLCIACAALALALITAPCTAQDDDANPYAGDAVAAREGQELFARSGCVPCHGPNAEGGIGPNLVDNEWMYRFSPGMVYRTIRNGRRGTPMISFKDRLTREQTWKIVEFLLATGREINGSSGK